MNCAMTSRLGSPQFLAPIIAFIAAISFSIRARAVSFQPVSQEELKLTGEPKAPAIILFREVGRDDRGLTVSRWIRQHGGGQLREN